MNRLVKAFVEQSADMKEYLTLFHFLNYYYRKQLPYQKSGKRPFTDT